MASHIDSIGGAGAKSEEKGEVKAEAISKLTARRRGLGPAVRVTVGLNRAEAADLSKLKSSMHLRTNAEVIRQLFKEATKGIGSDTSKSPGSPVRIIRLKEHRQFLNPKNLIEVSTLDDLATAADSLCVPVIEIPTPGEAPLFIAIDWSRDVGFLFHDSGDGKEVRGGPQETRP